MTKKKLLGALPVGFKGKFAGVPFSISVQYDIYGNVSAIVLSTENKAIISIDGDSKKIKALADKFFTYISTNTDQKLKTDADFKYFQKDYYTKIKDFVKNITEEVNDYNKKQMPIKKAVKKVAKKVATKKAIIKKAVKKSAPKKVVAKKIVKKSAPKKAVLRQTGTSNRVLDEMRQAKKPGKRTSADGNVYYEYRANRTDAGKLLGVSNSVSSKIDLKKLKEIGAKTKSPLTKKVVSILARNYSDGGYSSMPMYLDEILRNGLQSGVISELIYYKDTLAFYKKYKKEILTLLKETLYQYGSSSPIDIFGRNWDIEDFSIEDTQNQNLLAWFAFEETTRNLANQLGIEI